jgi:hypothetical protein
MERNPATKSPRSQPSGRRAIIIAALGVVTAIVALYLAQPLLSSFNYNSCFTMDDDRLPDSPPFIDVTTRLEFRGLRGANEVHCFPSEGGVWIADWVSPVELDFLGLDRFKALEKSENQDEEDIFCRRLQKVGAKLWRDFDDYIDAMHGARRKTKEEATRLVLGWPEGGGVYVLKVEGLKDDQTGAWTEGWVGGLGSIQNAYTMKERCQAIEKLGGVFYDNPRDCEDIRDLV